MIPALLLSVYEISSLGKDEKIIEEIYVKQLEALLFSVNQYSDNALSGWISKVEAGHVAKSAVMQTLLANPSVHSAFIVDTIDREPSVRFFSLDSPGADSLHIAIRQSLAKSFSHIQQVAAIILKKR